MRWCIIKMENLKHMGTGKKLRFIIKMEGIQYNTVGSKDYFKLLQIMI